MPEIFGKQVSKGTIYVGVGAAGLLGIALVRYRKQQQAAAATAAANAAAQAPGTGNGASDQIDPATGFPYGSAQDAAALTAQAGYNFPTTGYQYGYGGANTYPTTSPASFTSNAQWSQAAEQYMVGQGGDANTIGNALGKYITGQPVPDQTNQGLINEAIAFEGYPPVPGPNGFPPSINTANPGSTGSGGEPTQPTGVVFLNIPDSSGGWQAVSFPSAAAADSFYQSLGITPNGTPGAPGFTAFWPPNVPESKTNAALSAAGGTRVGPPGQNGYGIVKY